MRNLTSVLRKALLLTFFSAIFVGSANATIFTAVLSGNFNSSLTWGGIVPAGLLTSDIVIIPPGITVTLTSDETFSGTSTLTINGVLNSTPGSALIMTSGYLSGSGSISVDSLALGLTSGISYTGSIVTRALTSLGTNISSAANITVTNALNLTSGALNLTSGNLTLGNGSTINLSGGTVTTGGTGALHLDSLYDVVYSTVSATTGLELHGGGLHNVTVNVPGMVTLSSNDTVNGLLTLTSGALALNGHSLLFGISGDLSSTGAGTITGSALSDIIVNTAGNLTGALNFTSGGNVLHNLTINTGTSSDHVNLGSNLGIDGVLTLTSGMLGLNGHSLTLNGAANLISTVNGTISGTSLSDLVLNTSGSLTGALNFSAGGNILHNLTVNLGSGGTANLGSSLNINGVLSLQSGKLTLGDNNLTIDAGGMVNGGSSISYVVTNGLGNLVMNLTAGNTDTFAVGSTLNFAPIAVTANTGSTSGDVSVNVMNGILSNGTSGTLLSSTEAVVNATWYVSSTATSGINYNLTAMWSAGMEVNGFNRTTAFLSHYHGGTWDVTSATSAGTSGSLYTMSRTGITSLSPFAVTNGALGTTMVPGVVAANTISVQPNPTANTLFITSNKNIDNIGIYDLFGKQVKTVSGSTSSVSVQDLPAGTYLVRFTGKDVSEVRKFIKQ